jgi:hypothetical protein
VALGQVVHVVGQVAFHHVGGQQGVLGHATQGDAVIGQHVAVVLEVLADFFLVFALQPRAQLFQRGGEVELLGHARAVVCQRQVGGLSRRDGEAHADQARRHLVEAGGFGVERGERSGV